LEKNPNCCLFSVLESSQRAYTEKICEIQRVAEYYGIPVVDTLDAYTKSEYSYDALSPDTIHPGPLGEELYLQAFTEVLSSEVENASKAIADCVTRAISGRESFPESTLPNQRHIRQKAIDPRVDTMARFAYLPVENFTRVNDTVYELKDARAAGILGIYYWVIPGDNRLQITIDDELFCDKEDAFYHYNTQARIELLDKERMELDGATIRIVFDSLEQADGFRGLVFSDSEDS
jgi:hypothetical protein